MLSLFKQIEVKLDRKLRRKLNPSLKLKLILNRNLNLNLKPFLKASAGILLLSTCTKKDVILVGHFATMTGSEASFGTSTDEAIKMARDEVNAAGGIHGKKIEIITLDDQGRPELAAAMVKRLIEQDKVVAILGEVASTRTLAAAPIAQKSKIPLVTPSSTNPKVTQIGDYIFRTCFIDPFQGTVMANFTLNNLKLKKVAIFRDIKSDYSVGLADFFKARLLELGGTVVEDLSYQSGDVDFNGQLTKIKSAQPEAVFIPGYYTEVGLIALQARQAGIKAALLGGDGWESTKLYEIGKDAVEGGYFSNHYSGDSTDPIVVSFVKKYKEKYGRVPDGMAATGYDGAKILFQAIANAASPTPELIRDQLAMIKDYNGVTGKISMNEKRDAVKGAVVVQVTGKSTKFVQNVNP
ncbi:MAG: ethanolamine utilization protein EutJ [Bdellovibrio sp.]|nr:MAG: ethanolamine utilization protein EutJ [Bdellovibrio sp.]